MAQVSFIPTGNHFARPPVAEQPRARTPESLLIWTTNALGDLSQWFQGAGDCTILDGSDGISMILERVILGAGNSHGKVLGERNE